MHSLHFIALCLFTMLVKYMPIPQHQFLLHIVVCDRVKHKLCYIYVCIAGKFLAVKNMPLNVVQITKHLSKNVFIMCISLIK